MESHAFGSAIRRLLSHETCCRLRYSTPKIATNFHKERRRAYTSSGRYSRKLTQIPSTQWQQRTTLLPPQMLEEYQRAPLVTAEDLKSRAERPRNVKMHIREFIEDSLYNPSYGYFPKEATIFSPGAPFDFNQIQDEPSFTSELGRRYTEFEDKLDQTEYKDARQLWHTPTELFRPYYGEAIGRYLVTNYKLSDFPHHDLIIYELGAGNGTLMMNVLDFIRDNHPEVYERTKYRIIEISPALASLQAGQLRGSSPSIDSKPTTGNRTSSNHEHAKHVQIINQSILSWDRVVPSPCFVLALEVLDNLAHDSIRYDPFTEQPLQGSVLIDRDGQFYEFYSQDIDPVAQHFLQTRQAACTRPYKHPLRNNRILRRLRASLPFAPNLSQPEYIPSRLPQLFSILDQYFPYHKLLIADFDALPDAVAGVNAPVVQTRYHRRTIPVTTPLVMQGYFDILFPTDFIMVEDLYRALTGRLTKLSSQADWLSRWAYTEQTTCRNGENPMLSWYQNSSVLISTS